MGDFKSCERRIESSICFCCGHQSRADGDKRRLNNEVSLEQKLLDNRLVPAPPVTAVHIGRFAGYVYD